MVYCGYYWTCLLTSLFTMAALVTPGAQRTAVSNPKSAVFFLGLFGFFFPSRSIFVFF